MAVGVEDVEKLSQLNGRETSNRPHREAAWKRNPTESTLGRRYVPTAKPASRRRNNGLEFHLHAENVVIPSCNICTTKGSL